MIDRQLPIVKLTATILTCVTISDHDILSSARKSEEFFIDKPVQRDDRWEFESFLSGADPYICILHGPSFANIS